MTLHITDSWEVRLSNEKNGEDANLGFVLMQALVEMKFTFALERKTFMRRMDRAENYWPYWTVNIILLFSATGQHLQPSLILQAL